MKQDNYIVKCLKPDEIQVNTLKIINIKGVIKIKHV